MWFAACPACRSKHLRRESLSRGYPLSIRDAGGGDFCVCVDCGCREESIVRALDGAAFARAMKGVAA